MIVKRTMSGQRGAGYQRLAGYVLNVAPQHRPADPASWTRLNAHILDTERAGEKVAWERASNCQGDDLGWAVKEIIATQARNKRRGAAHSYHLVVSFADGEQPTRPQVEDIEERLCAALGYEEHQRVSAVHQNTDHWHLHVAISKVHPRTFRNYKPFYDYYRLQSAAVELEIRHGLRRTPHRSGPRTQEDYARIDGPASSFEVQEGRPSFLRWVRETAAAALVAARDDPRGWPGLHDAAARFDLEIRPYGLGLVIGHRSVPRLCVRASKVHRDLAFRAVTDALGPFQPPGQSTSAAPMASYATPAPSGPLYEAFTQARMSAIAARTAALAKLHGQGPDDVRQRTADDRDPFGEQRPTGAGAPLARGAFQQSANQPRHDRGETARRAAYERRRVRAQHPIPTWQGYLESEASNGNEAALARLRDRALHRAETEGPRLQAEDDADGRHIIHVHLRPRVRRDGRVIYRMADGGVVSDGARSICVTNVTSDAVPLALSLALERFAQRPLRVNGTDDFRAEVAALAGIKGLNLRFADESLEMKRASAERAHKTRTEHENGHADSRYHTSGVTLWRGRDR